VLEPLFEAGGAGTAYGRFRIVLDRTSKGGLSGATETTYTEKGKTCQIRFGSRIDSCAGGALELASETSFDIDVATCRVTGTGALATAKLVRERAPTPPKR
jgi:hypothetical protein